MKEFYDITGGILLESIEIRTKQDIEDPSLCTEYCGYEVVLKTDAGDIILYGCHDMGADIKFDGGFDTPEGTSGDKRTDTMVVPLYASNGYASSGIDEPEYKYVIATGDEFDERVEDAVENLLHYLKNFKIYAPEAKYLRDAKGMEIAAVQYRLWRCPSIHTEDEKVERFIEVFLEKAGVNILMRPIVMAVIRYLLNKYLKGDS